ncbi:MAG: hypothetical protein E6K54_03070 [Gammaproteobacteria bacterium]|nr:MAG: hypothetical protein E6K54_03070 [Gammaproteobacteria bacterium]
MQQFEKKYFNKQGYLNLRKLCPDNVSYLIEKTNNSELNIMCIDSEDVKSVDLIKWSDFSSEEKTEIAKTLLKNERQFYEKRVSEIEKKLSQAMMIFFLSGSISGIFFIIFFISPAILVLLTLPVASYGMYQACVHGLIKLKLARIDRLEEELYHFLVNTKDQEVKIEPNDTPAEQVEKVNLIASTPSKNSFFQNSPVKDVSANDQETHIFSQTLTK